MEERRKQVRQLATDYLFVWSSEDGTLLGQVADITEQGAMILSKKAISPESTFQCRMTLPRKLDGKEFVSFKATSKWCALNEESGVYHVGLEFSSITPGSQAALVTLIHSCKKRQPTRVEM